MVQTFIPPIVNMGGLVPMIPQSFWYNVMYPSYFPIFIIASILPTMSTSTILMCTNWISIRFEQPTIFQNQHQPRGGDRGGSLRGGDLFDHPTILQYFQGLLLWNICMETKLESIFSSMVFHIATSMGGRKG
jgi:hypothetical protein